MAGPSEVEIVRVGGTEYVVRTEPAVLLNFPSPGWGLIAGLASGLRWLLSRERTWTIVVREWRHDPAGPMAHREGLLTRAEAAERLEELKKMASSGFAPWSPMPGNGPNADLLLVAIPTRKLTPSRRLRLWESVVGVAVRAGADAFTIDSAAGTHAGFDESTRAHVERLLSRQPDSDGLRPLDEGLTESVVQAGPVVLALNLYIKRRQFAGISDWGDDVSGVFDAHQWAALRSLLNQFEPGLMWDSIEVVERAHVSDRPRG